MLNASLTQSKQLVLNASSSQPNIKHKKSQSKYTELEEIDLEDYPFYYSSSHNVTSKVPPISHTLNQKVQPSNKQLHTQLLLISRYAQDLENQLNQKNKHFERLEYMVKYLTIGQQKRDEIISHIQEENRKLLHQNKALMQFKQQEQLNKQLGSQVDLASSVNLVKTNVRLQSAKKSLKTEDPSKLRPESNEKGKRLRPKAKTDLQFDTNKTVLKIDLDTDIDAAYDQLDHVTVVKNLLADDEQFIQNIKETDYQGMLSIFDGLDKLFCEHSNLFWIVFRLRKLLNVAILMTSTMALTETLECLVDNICKCLESDRASVFIFDQETECLWTKVARGSSKKIQIPYNKGLVGHVFMTGESLNIRNAYSDTRFNKANDKATNYKTNTILSVPIKDKDGNNIIGVIQSVNKLKGYFSQDDEAFLQLISQLTSIVLRNSQQFDETITYHNNLRSILKTGIYLSQFLEEKDLIQMGIQKLKDFFSINKANILIVNREKNVLYTYDVRNFMKLVELPIDLGIAGMTYQKGDTINVTNAYNHEMFNTVVDLDTHMPIISMPIKDMEHEGKIVGILQIINSKGIQGLSSTYKAKVNNLDFEYLQFFGTQFAQSLQNAIKYSNK